jgi:SAM-dependent methyltransferase
MTMPTQPSKPQADAAAPDPAAGSRRGPGPPRPHNRAAGRPRGGLGTAARQFAGPSGPAGHLVTWLLARGNASVNRWLVREVAAAAPAPATVIELGCGPGVAPAELLRAYPAARVIGAGPSAVVLTSARRRNARALAEGRLTLVTGDIATAASYAPAGLVLACHVLYFWPDPVAELRRIREDLAPAGRIALGYQLRQNMPPLAQRTFPRQKFTLYDSDDQVCAALEQAGFTRPEVRIFGAPDRPGGAPCSQRPRTGAGDVDTTGRAQKADRTRFLPARSRPGPLT